MTGVGAVTTEGVLWISAVLGPLAAAGVLAFVAGSAVSGNPLRPRVGLWCGIACVVLALASLGLGLVRAGRLTGFAALAVVAGAYGGRAVARALPLLRAGARRLTDGEEHVRRLAREVYGDNITGAEVRFVGGDAVLHLTLQKYPVRSADVNLSSLARKRAEGVSDPVLRTFLGFKEAPQRRDAT